MTRHLADHPRSTDGKHLKRFAEIARRGTEDAPGQVWKNLHAKPAARGTAGRVRAFLRIERGHSA